MSFQFRLLSLVVLSLALYLGWSQNRSQQIFIKEQVNEQSHLASSQVVASKNHADHGFSIAGAQQEDHHHNHLSEDDLAAGVMNEAHGPQNLNEIEINRLASIERISLQSRKGDETFEKEVWQKTKAWAERQGLISDLAMSQALHYESDLLLAQSYFEFPLTVNGIAIEGATVQAMVQHPRAAGASSAIVRLDSATVSQSVFNELKNLPAARISDAQALQIARKSSTSSDAEVMESRSSYQKIAQQYRLIRTVRFYNNSIKTFVDLVSGQVWTLDSTVSLGGSRATMASVPSGSGQGKVLLSVKGRGIEGDPSTAQSQLSVLKLRHLKVTAGSKTTLYTNGQGQVELPSQGRPEVNVTAGLEGRYAVLQDAESRDMIVKGEVSTLKPAEAIFNSTGFDENKTAQVSAYYHQSYVRDWAASRGLQARLMDRQTLVRVNLGEKQTGRQCNAVYFSGSLNFFKSGKICAGETCIECRNSAIPDILYHEYGHLLDDAMGGIQESGLSEGWGDVLSVLITGSSELGNGFLKTGKPIRNADNDFEYRIERDPHKTGLALSGFTWQLRKLLMAKYGEKKGKELTEALILPSLLSNARDIPQVIAETYVRNDDDGNLANGTPDASEFQQAASRHGLEEALLNAGGVSSLASTVQ